MNWLDPDEVREYLRKPETEVEDPALDAAVEFVKAASKLEMSDGVHPDGEIPSCFECHQDEILAVIKLIARRLEGGDEYSHS